METGKGRKIALYGVLTALGLALSYLEMLVPNIFPVPGFKVGLANIVILTALYVLGSKGAVTISIIRIILVFFIFGNSVGLMYSLAGAVLSLLVMILLKKTGRFSTTAVSIAGAVSHNVGQIVVAMFLTGVSAIFWYLIILWFVGIAAGTFIGIISSVIINRLNR